MNQIEYSRHASEVNSWFGWYDQLVERVMRKALSQNETDVEETQFLLAA